MLRGNDKFCVVWVLDKPRKSFDSYTDGLNDGWHHNVHHDLISVYFAHSPAREDLDRLYGDCYWVSRADPRGNLEKAVRFMKRQSVAATEHNDAAM